MLHLMVGLPCSGKTTLAKSLERDLKALRLTPDEWQIPLFGQDLDHPDHDWRHSTIEDLLWKVAASALPLGVPVILDFGFWAKIERSDYRQRAHSLGVKTKIHYLDTPQELLFRRLEIRNELSKDQAVYIPPDRLRAWCSVFEPPDAEELGTGD